MIIYTIIYYPLLPPPPLESWAKRERERCELVLLVACRLSISLSFSLSLATYGSQSAFLSEVVKSDYIYATNFTSKGFCFRVGKFWILTTFFSYAYFSTRYLLVYFSCFLLFLKRWSERKKKQRGICFMT